MHEFLVGIDLGTSNCAVAFAEPRLGAAAPIIDFPVPQLQRPGEFATRPLLPSCIYLPSEHELPSEPVVGEYARWQGAKVPSRLVVSAKSWLSHSGVDRMAAILPWGAPSDVQKMSPVEASSRLLRHIMETWNTAHPDAALPQQEVVVTVPASFDEIARALTVNAARQAGLEKFTLVEEPQAAFYDFMARRRTELDRVLEGIQLVLVVDVGGGTTDFTLVEVNPALRRIAVGDHLVLGGDNMDAAVARVAEQRIFDAAASGRKLTSTQWSQLVQAARVAKEVFLGENAPERYHVSIAAEGSRLIGSALSTELSRTEVEAIVLDGFFPGTTRADVPRRGARVALQELGLPYAPDPAITRQLSGFLHAHTNARPDAILLNGGVFNSRRIASRLVEVVSSWWPDAPPIRVLEHDSLELAVARGAAYYGLVRHGMGRRIGGGTAHAFYVGLEKNRAVCIIPRGREEGETVDLGDRTFNLRLGRPVQFPLFTSTTEQIVTSGEIVPVTGELHALPPIHTVLKSADEKTGQIPVHLRATLTPIGTLELWCVSDAGNEQWRLEFELRGATSSQTGTVIESMPPRFAEARTAIETIYGGRPTPGTTVAANPKQLWRNLEQILGPREQWRLPVLRELWGALFAAAGRRRRSNEHERIYFQLAGYTLRPGFGYPLDEWRSEQTAGLFSHGVQHHQLKPVWIEFWVMWRRIAGGLTEDRQLEIWNYLKPHLDRRLAPNEPKHSPKPKGVQPEGLDEMVRLAGALEHLPVLTKIELGERIAVRLQTSAATGGPWAWALGRIGARIPLYGSVHKTVDPDKATEWLLLLLDAHARNTEGALFAIVQLARLTGDRSRDLDDEVRAKALTAVRAAQAPGSWERLLTEVVAMEADDQARVFGDTLPAGLAA
jgi:molecular chaperone DnaK (HSP70)